MAKYLQLGSSYTHFSNQSLMDGALNFWAIPPQCCHIYNGNVGVGEFIQGIHFLFVLLEGKEWSNNASSQLTTDSNSDILRSVILLEGPCW